VHPVDLPEEPDDWRGYARELLAGLGLSCEQALLVSEPRLGMFGGLMVSYWLSPPTNRCGW